MLRTCARKNGIIYNKTSIKHALRMLKDGISIRKAARYCVIPRESLRRWVTYPTSKYEELFFTETKEIRFREGKFIRRTLLVNII